MAIPRNVQRQGDRAEQIRKKVYEDGKTPKELGVKATPPPGEAPTEEPETPIIQAIEDPGKETPPGEDFKVKYEEALHQIEVLKGKLNSEVPDMVSVNREMAGRLAELQTTVSELQAKLREPVKEEPTVEREDPTEVKDLKDFSDAYPEIYRGTMILLKQWPKSQEFKTMVTGIVSDVFKRDVEPRVSTVEKDVKKAGEETFASKLDRLVKDETGKPVWRAINDDPEFVKTLKNKIYRGVSDFELLRAALGRGDAETVAGFFNDFLEAKKPAAKPPKEIVDDNKPVVDDESLAPSRPGAATPVKKAGDGDGKKLTFTRSFIKKFHTDVALGRYKNKPKERLKITADIDKAMDEGRIVNG